MQQEPRDTFHLFPCLPLEIRIQIWESATIQGRALKIRGLRSRTDYWPPTPTPGVTRACHESRKYCNYQKAFVMDGSPRYIWTNFDCDIISCTPD